MRQGIAYTYNIIIWAMLLLIPSYLFAMEDGGANVNPKLDGGGNVNPALKESVSLKNPLDPSISSIPAFFGAILDILIVFAIPFVVFFIILAGFKYVTARGNASKVQEAHMALLYAVIGGLIILGAQAILALITGTVNDFTN